MEYTVFRNLFINARQFAFPARTFCTTENESLTRASCKVAKRGKLFMSGISSKTVGWKHLEELCPEKTNLFKTRSFNYILFAHL